jgi:ADP-heptose:LPS heptosyltransferase
MNLVIKLPNDLREKILCFPFIHSLMKALKNNFKDEEQDVNLHLISTQENIEVLNLLPFFAYYHELKKEDLKSVFTIHRACLLLKIDHVDYFISTTESFVDATIGKNLKAKKTIGFDITGHRLFIKNRVALKSDLTKVQQYESLLNGFEFEIRPKTMAVCSRELPPLYSDWNELPYTMINLRFRDKKIWEGWIEFINLFQQKRFIFVLHDDELPNKTELIQEFIQRLPANNSYQLLSSDNLLDVAKAIAYSIALVSEDSALVQLAAYCGAKVFHLSQQDTLKFSCSHHFVGDVKSFPFNYDANFNYSFIFDEVYKYIDIRTKDFK